MKKFLLIIIVFSVGFLSIQAENRKNHNSLAKKISDGVPYSKFNINNISTYIYADGKADRKPTGPSGFIFPKGNKKGVVFQSGLVWGARINGQIHVGGTTYNSGLLPGKILSDGSTQDPNDPKVRVYRVRPDYKTSDLSSEVNDDEGTEEEIRVQYEKDWNEWPANDGAPFDDKNNDGIYEPGIDIPGVPGADQTLWFVANDLDSNQTKSLYGSLPFRVEVQVTVWGYADRYPFSNMIFKKYKIINKSSSNFDEMYFSIWNDPDIGDAEDDLVGCDTLLDLGYGYNGIKFDPVYRFKPPAVGIKLLQGPIIDGIPDNFAIVNGKKIYGKKNLGMTSFHYVYKNEFLHASPSLRNYIWGTLSYYNLMQGKQVDGSPVTLPSNLGGGVTKFYFSGDPVSKSGYIDGVKYLPGDRRFALGSGPFTMAPGDTQEVVFAQIAAQGSDNLNSIQKLKYFVSLLPKDIDSIKVIKKLHIPSVPVPTFSFDKFGSYNEITLIFNLDNNLTNFSKDGYSFLGIILYQLQLSDKIIPNIAPVKIATFDKVDGIKEIKDQTIDTKTGKPFNSTVFIGSDNGFKSKFKIINDLITGSPFIKGKKYTYKLTAYYYNPNAIPGLKVIKSLSYNRSTVFQDSVAGPTYGDTVSIQQVSGGKIVKIKSLISNPSKLTGHDYQITFNPGIYSSTWDLTDLVTNKNVLQNQSIIGFNRISHSGVFTFAPKGDGIKIRVFQKDMGFSKTGSSIVEIKYAGTLDETIEPWNTFYGSKVWELNHHGYFLSTPSHSLDSLTISPEYFGNSDYEIRFTDRPNFAVDYFDNNKVISVPFELWDIGYDSPDDPYDDVRMIPFVKMKKDTNSWSINSFQDFYDDSPSSDIIYWMKPDVNAGGYDAFANICQTSGIGNPYDKSMDTSPQGFYADFQGGFNYVIGNLAIFDKNRTDTKIPAGTVIRFYNYRPVTSDNVFQFRTETVKAKINPNKFEVFQNYPNPFNPSTTIRFFLPEDGNVKLTIYNILGQRVTELLNKKMLAGKYEIPFNGSSLASGIYLYTLKTDKKTEVRKMVLLK